MEPVLGIQGGAEKQVNSVRSYATEITQVLPSKARGAALLVRGISHQPWCEVWHEFTVSSKKISVAYPGPHLPLTGTKVSLFTGDGEKAGGGASEEQLTRTW